MIKLSECKTPINTADVIRANLNNLSSLIEMHQFEIQALTEQRKHLMDTYLTTLGIDANEENKQ